MYKIKNLVTIIAMMMLAIFLLVGCGSEKASKENSKPVVIGTGYVIDAVEPTKGGTPWSLTAEGISETVFMLNEKGQLVSRYVEDVKKIDSLTWELTLKKGVQFSDGSEIDADAFCAALNTVMKENPLSNATAGKVNFIKEDKYKVKVVTERETQNLKALLVEWTNILFKKTDNGYVFSGPFTIKKLDPKVSLELTPNKHYENADKRGEVIVKAFKDATVLKMAFQSGEVDVAFGLTPEMAQELKSAGKDVQKIDAGYQYFGILNMDAPVMADKKVREALDYGLNREDYIKALKGGRVATGLFAHYFEFAGDVKLNYNLDKAKALLDEDGWKVGADGIRVKDGQKLTLTVMTYNSRPDLKVIMQVMASQLKELGIEAKTSIVDAIDKEAAKRNFDIIIYAQHTAPTGDPSFYLNQFYRTGGSKNMSHYSSPEVDAMLNQMGTMPYGSDSVTLAKKIQSKIHEDLPVLFLVDPEWSVALSERMKGYKIYSGDYYVVNANLYAK